MKIEHKKIFRGPSKILENISWPINICLKYFMAPTKTLCLPLPAPPTYLMYGPVVRYLNSIRFSKVKQVFQSASIPILILISVAFIRQISHLLLLDMKYICFARNLHNFSKGPKFQKQLSNEKECLPMTRNSCINLSSLFTLFVSKWMYEYL